MKKETEVNELVWHTDSMWTSSTVDKITKAMVMFNAENITIEKRGEANINAQVKRKYVKLDDIMNAVRPVLAKHGCYIEQHLAGDSVVTRIVHESGQFIASKLHYQTWEANQVNNLQRLGGGLTYLKRYAVSALLNIVADEDADGEGSDIKHKPQEADNREWLNLTDKSGRQTERGATAVKYIKDGGRLEDITKKYKLNKTDFATLAKLEKDAQANGQRLEDIYHETESEVDYDN